MKVYYPRISTGIVAGALILAGFLSVFNQPIQRSEIDLGESFFTENNIPIAPDIARGTRAGPDWPMHRGDLPHSGYSTVSAPNNNAVLWTNTTGNGDGYGSASIADGKVYVGSGNGYLYCFDLDTGDRLWSTYINSSGGFGVMSTPAVANDHVYVFASGNDSLFRVRASDGVVTWNYDPGGGAYGGSSPAVYNGRVYFGSGNAYFYCVDEISGSLIWSYQGGAGPVRPYGIQSSPAVANGRIFIGSCDTYLYCFEESQPTAPVGQYLWRTSLNDAIFGSAAVANGRVYCGSGYYVPSEGTNSHTMFCLDELTGGVIWSYTTGGDILSSPAIAYGNCYFTSTDGDIYCVDADHPGPTPTFIWSNTTGDTWSSPAVADGKVIVGSHGTNRIYCFDATNGDLLWEYNAGNDIYSSPAIADGRVAVYVRGFPETLICFGTSVAYTVDYIDIMSQPFGGGIPITDQTVGVSTVITGHAAAYNNSAGYLYDVPVNWSVINGGGANASTSPLISVSTSDFSSGYNGGISTWTADDGNGHTDSIFFTIDPPTIDYIEIVDIGNTGTFPIGDQSVAVGFSIQGYAAAFNNNIGYLWDVVVTWSVTNLSGAAAYTTPLLGTSSMFNADLSGGIGVWIADDGAGHNDSVSFAIIAPTVNYIEIVDTPGTGSTAITGQPVDVGFSIQGYAASFNDTVGYIGDISVTWYVVNSSGAEGSTSPSSGTGSTLDVGVSGGTVVWWADDGSGRLDSVTFTVNPPEIDYIVIRTGPNGTGSWVGGTTYTFGQTDTFYAAGYNNTAGWVMDVDALWDTDNSSVGSVISGPSNSTTFTAQNNGTCTINATYNALTNNTGMITVIYYNVEYIIIRDTPGNGGSPVQDMFFGVGDTANFYAAAYNSTAPGNYIGDVDVEWYVSNTSLATITTPGVSTLFSAQFIGGVCNVTAVYDSSLEDVTGNLTVSTATLDYILITETPGGPEVMDVVLNVGEFKWLNASGYNASGPTYIGPVSVNWSQASSVIGTFSSSPSTSTTFTAGNSEGFTTVWATFDPSGLALTDNFTITINEPGVDYILIRDAPGGSGSIVGSDTYVEFDTDTFYAAAYNNTVGYLFEADVSWFCNDTLVGQVTTPGSSTTFTALDVDVEGICYVAATYNAQISDQTGTLTVLPINVEYIQIRDAPDGGGNIVDTRTYAVWETDEFHAAAYSNLVGFLYDVDVTWESSDTSAGQITTPGLSTTFTAQVVDANSICIITARYSDSVLNATGLLTVLIRSVDYIQIRDVDNNLVDAIEMDLGEWAEFYTIGFNYTGGYMGYVTVSWSIADNIGTLDPTHDYLTNLTASAAGTSTLTASYNLDVTNSTQITITTRISAPTGVEVEQLPQGGALNISWNENPEENLAGYDIYISLSPTGPFTKINSELITTTNFVDEGLTNGIRYYYYIRAVDTSGVSSVPSEIANGIPDRDTDGDGTFDFIDEDDDDDGLPDVTEALWNTNPLIADSDGDGVNDGEDYFPTDPAMWDKPDEEGGEISLMWILIPVIVLVVLLLLFFLLARRKKPEEPAPPSEQMEEFPPPPGALAEEGLPPPPEDFEPPAPDEEELPPPPDDSEFPPPPEENELPAPPDEEELPPPPEKEEIPPTADEELPPPSVDESLPPPPPWLKKKAQFVPLGEEDVPPPP